MASFLTRIVLIDLKSDFSVIFEKLKIQILTKSIGIDEPKILIKIFVGQLILIPLNHLVQLSRIHHHLKKTEKIQTHKLDKEPDLTRLLIWLGLGIILRKSFQKFLQKLGLEISRRSTEYAKVLIHTHLVYVDIIKTLLSKGFIALVFGQPKVP